PRVIRAPFDWMGPETFRNTPSSRRLLWALAGPTLLAAAIRFSTLGLQSCRHDEGITAGRSSTPASPRPCTKSGAGVDAAALLCPRLDPVARVEAVATTTRSCSTARQD